MIDPVLHITNGDSLTQRLQQLDVSGELLTWREMLCEGPTTFHINTTPSIQERVSFFKKNYDVSDHRYTSGFIEELKKLQSDNTYTSIILWFEYDLFCHINMIACISYLKQLKRNEPIFLVCSGQVEGEKRLLGLSELKDDQLLNHYNHKIPLDTTDINLASTLWKYYCSDDPKGLVPELAQSSNFPYLENCLQAYRERFPNKNTGLSTLEYEILKAIHYEEIASEHQLCGYMLRHQLYYGFGDSQLFRIIERLRIFFDATSTVLLLNSNGKKVLDGETVFNLMTKVSKDIYFGGVKKYEYHYDPDLNQLVHTKE